MAREWYATCKDCGKEFGYSHASFQLSSRRGLSRPERCANCRKLHTREVATLGLSHYELAPVRPIPADGLRVGRLGGLIRPDRVHIPREEESTFDFDKFGIKDQHIREFFALMQQHQITVIVAPTGAGKSTFLPYRLMVPPGGLPPDLFTRYGQIIVTQPRIQATRNIPLFVARDLHGSSLGAGFDVGFRHSGSPATDWRNKLVYMTDGTLINMIVRNELGRLSVIMIDEAHERSLNIDLILGLLKAQLPRYPHLRLIIASATIDTKLFLEYYGGPQGVDPEQFKIETDEGGLYDNAAIAQHLADSPVGFYGFPGKRQYPVETRFREGDPIPVAQMPGRMPDEVARKVVEVLGEMETAKRGGAGAVPQGDILAFLQGEKPIERAVAAIREMVDEDEHLAGKVDVFPLYTRLPQGQQDAALQPKRHDAKWRVVVSTNVAETSLTVNGIVHVVDSGLINESQWDPQTQTAYVVPKAHSRAGCIQRWGRAGRVQAGVAHCLYTEEQFQAFDAHTDPEILRDPLEQIVLTAKAAGVDDIKGFDWIQRPDRAELDRAPQVLQQIGALDEDGDLTEHGLELRSFAEETDIANLMILADRFGCAVEMATLIAMRKLGGYTSLLRWDKGWDAPTKRTVHLIHQGLLGPCLDDLEFYLKLWDAWDGSAFGRTENKDRAAWAGRFFVNHRVFRDQIAPEREALLVSMSGHKKDNRVRPVDFDLLTRLRIVMTYGLPNQIYQLANPPALGEEMSDAPIYSPYIANPDANPDLVRLHADAIVEISPESVCFGQALDNFVCGKRQRLRRRLSPQSEPLTIITAAFLTLIRPEWLQCIGQPPMAVAHLIAAETRDDRGVLIPTTTRARLFLDQSYPVGATFECQPTDSGEAVTIGTLRSHPRLRVGSSWEDVEAPEEIEILETEGALSEIAGADEDAKEVALAPDEEEGVALWADMLDDDEELGLDTDSLADHEIIGDGFHGRVIRSPNGVPIGKSIPGVVAGYDFDSRQEPTVLLEIPAKPAPFDRFRKTHAPGDDVVVEVLSIERYVNDWLTYLVVREVETGLEIVMDPYDASLIGRNFAIEMLKPGIRFTTTVEEIDQRAHRVRVTRLKAAEEVALQFMGRERERVVDAQIVEVRDNGLYLWLDPANTKDHMSVGSFVHLSRLPQRPDEMALGQPCRVSVRPRHWNRPLRRAIITQDEELEARLASYSWDAKLYWDEANRTLVVNRRITYHQRRKLLSLSSNGNYRRTVNMLYRRSNELDVRVIDMTGLQNLVPYQGRETPVPARVKSIVNGGVFIETEDGLEAYVPKHEVDYDRNGDLCEKIAKGDKVDAWVRDVDLDQGRADLSLLDPEKDPLNDYQPGQMVHGHVVNVTRFGAFVELSPGVQGLVPMGELAWWHVEQATGVVQRGQMVKVEILNIDRAKRRLTLTMRLPENDPLNKYQVDQRMNGTVVGFTRDGIGSFVELEPGVEGFLYKDEITLDRVDDARQVLSEGQEVTVRITEIDRVERKLRLTIRGLYESVLLVPSSHAGLVIGRGGSTIKEIMRATQTHIQLENDGECLIQGLTPQHVQAAEQRIRSIVATRIVTFTIQERQIGMLIGKGGRTIQGIQRNTGAQVDVDGRRVTVTSANDQVLQHVLGEVRAAISFYEANIQVPAHRVGRVIGRGGSTIENIRSRTGVRVDVAKDSSGRIKIEGKTRADVERAVQLIAAHAGSTSCISVGEGTLPPWSEVCSDVSARPNAKARRQAQPIFSRQPALAASSQTAQRSSAAARPRPSQPQMYQQVVQVPIARLTTLIRKQGGFFATLLGGGQSPVEKIQAGTGTQIRIDTSTGIVRVTGRSEDTVSRAVQEIWAVVG